MWEVIVCSPDHLMRNMIDIDPSVLDHAPNTHRIAPLYRART